jgi:hypothetical protein
LFLHLQRLKLKQTKLMSKFGLALIAVTALSVAVATQAYNIQAADAQAKIPNNSVRSETIVDGQVKTADLANDAVTSLKIADGTIQEEDIEDGVISEAGVGTLQKTQRVEGSITLGPGELGTVTVSCESGEIATGGGFSKGEGVNILNNYNAGPGENWQVVGRNTNTDGRQGFLAFVECLKLVP